MEWNSGTGQAPVNKPAAHAGGKRKISLLSISTASVGLVICIALLLAALTAYFVFGKSGSEKGFVDKGKMQAVFLNGGQVYFGKITDLNNKFMRVSDIYYLRVNQTVQPNQTNNGQQPSSNDISLVKLGCELHGPQDSMVINQEQVIFWENLKDDGQVAKAVATYKEQNPNGQDCSKTNQTTGTDTNNATTPSTNTGTGTGTGTNNNNNSGTNNNSTNNNSTNNNNR